MMGQNSCPKCGRHLSSGQELCACGYSLRRAELNWRKGSFRFGFPETAKAWVLIALAFPATFLLFAFLAWLDWFHLGRVEQILLSLSFVVLPLGCQFLPNLRGKNGGCCLGCFMWFSVFTATLLAGNLWSFKDPIFSRENKPIALFVKGEQATISGLHLGQFRREAVELKGPAQKKLLPFCPGKEESFTLLWEDGTKATLVNEVIVRLEGPSLEQRGKVLVKQGQPRSRMGHIFETSSFHLNKRFYKTNKELYAFHLDPEHNIKSISVKDLKYRVKVALNDVTVNGVRLGQSIEELPEAEMVRTGQYRLGRAYFSTDDQGRVKSITGTVLKKEDGILARASGDEEKAVNKLHVKGHNRFHEFEGGLLRLVFNGSAVERILYRF